jgi:hypothetical protein
MCLFCGQEGEPLRTRLGVRTTPRVAGEQHRHQVVAFAENRGTPLGESDVKEFARQPSRGRQSPMIATFRQTLQMLAASPEPVLEYLVDRQMVVKKTGGALVLTPLGDVLLQHAQTEESDLERFLSVELESNDPLAGADVYLGIRSAGACLVVDPFLRAPQLLDLVRYTDAARVLRSPRANDDLTLVLRGTPAGRIEVREIDGFHDRYIIPANGRVIMLGTSLGSVGERSASVLVTLPEDLSQQVRSTNEKLWKKADPVRHTDADDGD